MGKQKVILLRDPGWLPGGSVNLMYKVLGVMRGGNKWGADPSLKVVAGKNFRFSALQSGSLQVDLLASARYRHFCSFLGTSNSHAGGFRAPQAHSAQELRIWDGFLWAGPRFSFAFKI